MADLIMQKLTQIGLVLSSGFIYLINQVDGSIISKAFDQLFSLGLLAIVVVMLYREWKASQEKFKELQSAHEANQATMQGVIEKNTRAFEGLQQTLREYNMQIKQNAQNIENLRKEREES